MKPELEQFKGHLVKCVYRDGTHVTVVKGNLIEITDDFIQIRSLENIILIRVSEILKIQRGIGRDE